MFTFCDSFSMSIFCSAIWLVTRPCLAFCISSSLRSRACLSSDAYAQNHIVGDGSHLFTESDCHPQNQIVRWLKFIYVTVIEVHLSEVINAHRTVLYFRTDPFIATYNSSATNQPAA